VFRGSFRFIDALGSECYSDTGGEPFSKESSCYKANLYQLLLT